MNLQVFAPRPFTFLPSGILIVEAHEGLLTARNMLIAAAEHYVCASSLSGSQTQHSEECEVAIAILSESLGYAGLCETAQIVRKNWPRARILIFGSSRAAIEDNLYDARIDQRARPEDLLAALLMLTEYPRNQTLKPAAIMADGRVSRLLSGGAVWAESHPTKEWAKRIDTTYARDLPGGEQDLRRGI